MRPPPHSGGQSIGRRSPQSHRNLILITASVPEL